MLPFKNIPARYIMCLYVWTRSKQTKALIKCVNNVILRDKVYTEKHKGIVQK